MNEEFPSTTSHESGEEREDITDTESEDFKDGGNELSQSPAEVIEEVFSSVLEAMPRTKEEIVGWCSGNESDEGEIVVEEPVQRNPKLELLPSTAKDLYNRFKILHCQFLCHGKYEKRSDLVVLLNEVLRRY